MISENLPAHKMQIIVILMLMLLLMMNFIQNNLELKHGIFIGMFQLQQHKIGIVNIKYLQVQI